MKYLQQSHVTYLQILDVNRNYGSIKSFNQELRLANDARSSFRWVVGANSEHSRVREDDEVNYADSTSSYVNTQVIGQDYDQAGYNNRQRLKHYAVFGNVEYDISDQLPLKGGIRYNETNRSSVHKTFDLGDGSIPSLFTTVINTYRDRKRIV